MITNLLLKTKNKAEKRWSRFGFGIWLILAMILAIGQEAKAQDRRLTTQSNYYVTNNTNGYVTFRIPFFDDDGDNEYVKPGNGSLYIQVDGGDKLKILTYGSDTGGKDVPEPVAKMTLHKGCAIFKTKSGNEEVHEGVYCEYKFVRDGEYVTWLTFDWYYPSDYEAKEMRFSVDATVTFNGSGGPFYFNKEIGTGGYNARKFSDPTLGDPALSTEVGKYQMIYNTTETPVQIWNSIANQWSNSTDKSGTLYAAIQDTKREYTFKVKYQLNQFYLSNEHSVTKTIRAFHQAQSFNAVDAENGNTLLTWSIANNESNCETGDNFEIQRADNPSFDSPESIGTVGFLSTQTNYTFTDKSGNLNLNGTIYYRIRRTKQPAWGWNVSQQYSIVKNVSHRNVVSATATWNKDSRQSTVSWKLDDIANNKVWSEGAKVIVTRSMDYGNGTITKTELIVGDADIKKGFIVDNLDVLCVKYSYTVHVKPGNTHFEAQTPVTATGDKIFPTEMGNITSLTVSKGYYPTYTSLQWTTDEKAVDQFQIMRRTFQQGQGNDEGWETLDTKEGGAQASYVYTDDHGLPGVIYEYQVRALTKCADETSESRSDIVRGFRSPTGSISGQILFKYGDAMVGAEVLVTPADPSLTAGQSLKFAGNTNSCMETVTEMTIPTDASIQLFVKPATENQDVTLLSWGHYRVGVQKGKAAISADKGANWQTTDATLPTNQFTQLTAVFDTEHSLYLYVGGEKVVDVAASGKVAAQTGKAQVTIGKSFNGYIDEIRLWERALDAGKGDIKNTYNRLLVGNESGLAAYWRLNDPVADEAYDISYTGTNYHKNHATLKGIELSTEHPTDDGQLGLRALTDEAGNFQITGVPYVGNETSYTVTPSYPGHTFEPTSTKVTIGNQQPVVAGTNFKDASAITIEGYVFYENSSIPVKDATFTIDDGTVILDGQPYMTSADGKFKFSVPAGTHTVRVQKANHTFKNNGRLADSNGQDLDYQQAMADVRFWDQTKVKLIGRVAGGTVEQNKPLGFSLSKNNLGDSPTLVLKLEGDASSEIYDKDAVYKDGQLDKDAPDEQDSTMVHWNNKYDNGVSYQQQQIVITPDAETGEYEAWLYPVKYKVTQATVTGWDELLPEAKVVDLQNVFTEQTSEYTDEKDGKTYRLAYNETYSLIHRVNPTITYKQGNASGATTDYFGLQYTTIPDLKGLEKPDTLVLYDKENKEYLFKDESGKGLPVFSVGTWGFYIEATEDYAYNGVKKGEDAKVDRVPTQGGDVSITNTFNQNAAPQKAQLDNQGRLYVGLTMNRPRFASNDYGKLSITVEIDGKTYNADELQGFLLGPDPKTDGLDFVTAGPITLLNILRDPPGSHSYTWWESGQSYSYYTMNTDGFTNVGTEGVTTKLGVKTATGIGIGAMVLTETEMENNIQASINHEETTNHPDARTMTVTTNSRYQTSDDPLNVGSAADVFIGFSNNLYYGAVNELELLDEETYKGKEGSNDVYATAKKDGKTYYICKGSNLNVSVSGSTLFSYPKMHIENIVIPNLETLRNNMLYTPDAMTESEAQGIANAQNRMVYLSKVSKDDESFGSSDSYKIIIPSKGVPTEEQEDKFLTSFLGRPTTVKDGTPDSIAMYNNAIKEWIRVLKQNEDEKLAAIKADDIVERNRSFHASSPVEYTESYETAKEEGYSFEFTATAGVAAEIGFTLAGAGVVTTIDQQFGGVGADEQNSSEGDVASTGFVLADEGDFDYISVDVLRSAPVDTTFRDKWNNMYNELGDFNDQGDVSHDKLKKCVQYGNFVFKTRGGATACPYEPAEYTQYQDGSQKLLNEATMQIERPSLEVDKPVVTNVPSDQAAVYNLKLMNDSQVSGATAIFTIAIVDAANQKGAKFSIDGVPLGEGRGIEVPYGEVLNKVLEVRRGTEYDYEDLALVLKSQCQSDPTDNQADIADTVYISAHFIPSSSDINIKTPTDKWTLNTQSSLDSTSGKYYMPLTIDGFDVNFTGFDHIEIQYKPSSGSDKDWTNICSFFNDSVPYKAASGEKAMIEGATVSTRFYGAEDQKYDIRAVTFSKVGNEFVTKSSPIISGVKDTKRPVVFGNIQPADGVLGIEDEIRLNFNEEIAEGYMTDVKNFQVTAVRNGSNGDHSTSLTFDGASSFLATQAERNLTDKDISVEMWVLPSALGRQMTLFSHGTTTNSLELAIGADNSILVSIGGQTYSSKPQNFKTTDWAHIAMSYKASNRQLSAYFGGVEVIAGVQTSGSNTSIGPMQFGRSVRGDNYFAGKMHEARVWNKVVSSADIMANKLTIYTGQEAGMLAYYPMNDGKGDRVTDKAQGATVWIYGADWSTLAGLSVAFKGDTLMAVNTSKLALTDEQDYTLEFWFKAAPGQKDAALVSNGKGVEDENNTNHNKVFAGFIDNKLVFRNNGYQETLSGKWDDDSWHHFAIAVNRNAGNAQIFIDGALNSYFDAGKLGGFSGTSLYLGARRWTEAGQMVDHTDMYLNGQVDELRLWNMALPSAVINKNYNICPKGTEMGLMLYLPFHKYITNSANIREMVFSGEDLVTDSTLVADGNRLASEEKAPVRAKGPEVSIPFTFVVNKDALVINLMDTPEALEKTTVNFTVKDVSDLNGNLMQSPVTWSAYINRNQLKWSETSVTKEKKLYAPMTFMVDVENQGGTEKNFTIEGLPAWLKADPEYGTIDPLGRQTILFTVDEGTNVGRYDEVVYVKGDNNVSEALPVTLKVFDQQPDWAVDPADFKYNMNIYGKLRVNKLFSTDAEDMIAVFDGGRCVGVANNQYADKNDMWYVFMTVYGNEIRGSEALSFRVWDASTGTVYDAYCDSPITFGSNSIVGTASDPVVFDAEERVVQNINLSEGWNWVSFNVKSDTPDLATILRNSMLVGDEQVKDEAMGSFAAYDKDAETWLGDNIIFDNKHMYLIQSSVAQKLSVSGIAIKEKADLTIPVAAKKWNYISYLPMTNLPITEALSGYNAKEGDIIKSQNAFSMYGVKTGWLGNLTYMEPGKGYMLLNNGDTTSLAYPDMMGGSGLRSSGLQTRSGDAMATGTAYTDTRFDANMSVVATVAESLPVYAGDKLQAYVGGELRGEALLTEDPYDGKPLYFVSIGGDRNEAVSFALERGGEVIAETSPMFDYRVNNVQGSIEQPVILDFVNDLQISVYPNPFERELNFVMNIEAGDKIGIYLYTMAGQMIHRHTETSVNGGYLHYRWECYEDLARTVYMAVVVVNGQKHAYKVKRK